MIHRGASAEKYEILTSECRSGIVEDLRHDRVSCYRTKTVEAGTLLYVSLYPVIRDAVDLTRARERLGRPSSLAQQIGNRRRAMERVEQVVNYNFEPGDVFATLTYDGEQPEDEIVVKADLRKYIRVLRTRAKKLGNVLKALYVIEYSEPWDTAPMAIGRWHLHMVIQGVPLDDIERMWQYGTALNTTRLHDSKERFSGVANYMLKRRRSWRTWGRTRNCVTPPARTRDRRPSKAKVERIARDVRVAAKEIFEAVYPGWQLIEDAKVLRNDYIPGVYIRARLRRIAYESMPYVPIEVPA